MISGKTKFACSILTICFLTALFAVPVAAKSSMQGTLAPDPYATQQPTDNRRHSDNMWHYRGPGPSVNHKGPVMNPGGKGGHGPAMKHPHKGGPSSPAQGPGPVVSDPNYPDTDRRNSHILYHNQTLGR